MKHTLSLCSVLLLTSLTCLTDAQGGPVELGNQTIRVAVDPEAKGSVGLCFVNVSDEPVEFDLPLLQYAKYLKNPAPNIVVRHNGAVVAGPPTGLGGTAAKLQLTIQPQALLFVTLAQPL